jgi:uncharacterized protein YceK
MKKILLVLVVVLVTTSCGSVKVDKVMIPGMDKVVTVALSKNKGYVKANEWAVTTFANAQSVIQFSDKEEGVIMGKYILANSYTGYTVNAYTGISTPYTIDAVYALVRVQAKEGAAKITITPNDFTHSIVSDGMGGKKESYSREQAIVDVTRIMSEFETYMKGKNKSDW